MSNMKTVVNDDNAEEFLNSVQNTQRREDAMTILAMMKRITGEPPRMWGTSIVGFGQYTYQRADKSKHQWMLTGFSPRKQSLTIYIMPGFSTYPDLLAKLGKHKHSVSCLYINRLANVDLEVLEVLIKKSVTDMKSRYGA